MDTRKLVRAWLRRVALAPFWLVRRIDAQVQAAITATVEGTDGY